MELKNIDNYNVESVCVIGLGYIGLPLACCLAKNKINVSGIDINQKVINSLKMGRSHIIEPGLDEVLGNVINSGFLKFFLKPKSSDVFIIAVETPVFENKTPNLKSVISAVESIIPVLKKGDSVILESTVPSRTTIDVVKPILEKSGLEAGKDFYLSFSPERIIPGNMLYELENNSRIVGGLNEKSAQICEVCYKIFVKGDIYLTDCTTAETVKLMENTYRDINIAIANEFSRLSNKIGFNVNEAIQLANCHPRVDILNPGIGVGGHCISVDPWFIVNSAPEISKLTLAARKINDSQPKYFSTIVENNLNGNLNGKKIAILGITYKPNVDDIRESPAIDIVNILISKGAVINVYDPYCTDPKLDKVNFNLDLDETIFEANAVIFLVPHSEFDLINPVDISKKIKDKIIFDPCNFLKQNKNWLKEGFKIINL